jgi:CBS domain containing-hemolysin-like protein
LKEKIHLNELQFEVIEVEDNRIEELYLKKNTAEDAPE